MSVEKNKRSHRVVVRDTLCVFVIISLPLEDSRKLPHPSTTGAPSGREPNLVLRSMREGKPLPYRDMC